MAWAFSWAGSWREVWEPGHVAAWRQLAEAETSAATPFMHPATVGAWVAAMGGEARLRPHFLHARHEGGQRVLWPLVRPRVGWKQGFLRRLVPVGTAVNPYGSKGMLFDYHDPIAAPALPGPCALAPGFWPALRAELAGREAWFDTLSLPRLRQGCLGDGCLGESAAAPWPSAPVDVAPLLDLARYPDLQAYVAARSPKMRETLRRRRRRLEAAGRVELHVFAADELDAVLAWLPRLEAERQRRWQGGGLPPGYLAALARAGLPAGVVHASALRLDGRDVAWDLGLTLGGVHYGYIKGFDPAFQALSPGSMHLLALIGRLIEDGVRRLDFMLGAEAYKADWTDGAEVAVRSLGLTSRRAASRLRRAAAPRLAGAFGRRKPRAGG